MLKKNLFTLCLLTVLLLTLCACSPTEGPQEKSAPPSVAPTETPAAQITSTLTPLPTVAPFPSATAESAKIMYVTASAVNVRENPSTNSTVLQTLTQGGAVTVLQENVFDGWHKISLGGQTAYCASQYLSETKPAPIAKPTASAALTGEALRKQIVAWTAGRDYDKMNQTLHFTLEKQDEYGTYYATTAQAPGVNFVCRQSTDDHGEKHFSFDDIEAPASVLFPEYIGMDYGEIPYYLSMPKNYIVALRDPYGEYSILVEDISVGDHVEEKLKADHLVRMLPN
jgi:hypothetical protein